MVAALPVSKPSFPEQLVEETVESSLQAILLNELLAVLRLPFSAARRADALGPLKVVAVLSALCIAASHSTCLLIMIWPLPGHPALH